MNTESIDDLLANPKIPTLPSAALRVLEKVGSPDCTLDAVGEIVRQDPALCGLMLKTLNSALYSFSRPVTSVDKAMVMLGLTRIRSLILTLYLPAIRSTTPQSPAMLEFWRSSVIGAIVTRELSARSSRRDPESDLLAALMRDLGRLVLMHGAEARYRPILEACEHSPHQASCEKEREIFGLSHADMSGELLRRWRLPEAMWKAIKYHHDPRSPELTDNDLKRRTEIIYFASLVGDFLTRPHIAGLRELVLSEAQEFFEMDEDTLGEFLAPLGEKARNLAAFLNVDMGVDQNFAVILANASQELVRLAMETSLESLREQENKKKAEEEAARWREKAEVLQERTSRDALTGLHNRGYLVEALERSLHRAIRIHQGVGLLFIDLDGFKPINDTFGHAAGDVVLKEVAAQFRMNVREHDVTARFGGDEFCILLPECTEAGLQQVGERVVRMLNEMPLEFDGKKCRIGGSVGAAFCLPWSSPIKADALMEAADHAMYEAKKGGKNRVALRSLLIERDRQAIEAVRKRMFREFLILRHGVEAHKIDAADNRRSPRSCLLRIARRMGWVSRDEAVKLARVIRRENKTFIEAVLAGGRYQWSHVWTLIAVQQDPPEFLAKRLVRTGVLSEGDARLALQSYFQWIGARRVETPPRPEPTAGRRLSPTA